VDELNGKEEMLKGIVKTWIGEAENEDFQVGVVELTVQMWFRIWIRIKLVSLLFTELYNYPFSEFVFYSSVFLNFY